MTSDNRRFVPSPELDPQLESAVWSVLSVPIDMAAVERVKTNAQKLPAKLSKQHLQAISKTVRHRRMFSLISLAAGILLVVGAALLPTSPSTAFAQAIEQLKSAGAFRYTTWIYTNQQEKPIEAQVLVDENGRERRESSGTVSVLDSDGQLRLTLVEATKTAIVPEAADVRQGPEAWRRTWLEQLKSHGNKPDKQLGTKTLDGRKVEGFVAKQGRHDFTIWVDAETKELVQIEFGGMIEGSPIKKVVMNDFQFNQKFDEALFSFKVPSGYKVMEFPRAPVLLLGEEAIVAALRGFTKISDGKFPKSLADWGEWAVAMSQSGASREESAAMMSSLGAITPFLFSMSKGDYQYLGAGKTTSDARSIVFWRRTKDGVIRAIYNDFSVVEINEADLPKS